MYVGVYLKNNIINNVLYVLVYVCRGELMYQIKACIYFCTYLSMYIYICTTNVLYVKIKYKVCECIFKISP